jgi:hypothetical protein
MADASGGWERARVWTERAGVRGAGVGATIAPLYQVNVPFGRDCSLSRRNPKSPVARAARSLGTLENPLKRGPYGLLGEFVRDRICRTSRMQVDMVPVAQWQCTGLWIQMLRVRAPSGTLAR